MSIQIFKLAILYLNGAVVEIPAGGKLEKEFVESVVKRIVAQGVGVLKTEAQVAEIIRTELTGFITDLKDQTRTIA